jgi:threonine dehydratase
MLTLEEISQARDRIRALARLTPLVPVALPGDREVHLKCESLQPGGAFKIRGACNMLAQLDDEARGRGVITYSSGNHGQALALAARAVGAPAVVVMPTTAPAIKVERARGYGAEVMFAGTTSVDRRLVAEQVAADRGLTMVPPFDHEWIIAGQATIGIEILDALPEVGTIVAPIGGGGLIAGIAAAVGLVRPEVRIVGVEPSGAASMRASLEAGHPVTLPGTSSIADGLLALRPGDLTFAYAHRYVDEIVTVDDYQIARAVIWAFAHARLVVEPSGAASLAAILSGTAGALAQGPIVAIVSGGNLAPETFQTLLQRDREQR